jgi:type I restriction enzyme, S subunit
MNSKWPKVPIIEIADMIDCVNRTAPVVEGPTPYKMIRTTNVKKGRIDLDDVRYVTEEVYRKWTRRGIPKIDDVILTREAPLGEVGIIRNNESIFLGQRLVQYRVDPKKYVARFLFYSLQGFDLQGQIRSMGSGATVEHMRLEDCIKLLVPLPSLLTQRKIAAILSAYDDLIENNLRRIKVLEELAQNLYREWFVNFRFPDHEKVKIVDSPLGKIPEEWELNEIGDVIETLGGGTPSTKVAEYWEKGEVTWFTPSDLTSNNALIITESGKKISKKGLNSSSAKLFPPYSVMMTSRATIGVVSINTKEACTNQGFIVCIPNEKLPFSLIYYWILQNRDKIINVASGATYKEISRGEFREMPIAVPDRILAKNFHEIIQSMFKEIEALIFTNQNLRQTRDLLLPKLITGELDVSDLDIKVEDAA